MEVTTRPATAIPEPPEQEWAYFKCHIFIILKNRIVCFNQGILTVLRLYYDYLKCCILTVLRGRIFTAYERLIQLPLYQFLCWIVRMRLKSNKKSCCCCQNSVKRRFCSVHFLLLNCEIAHF